MDHDLMISSAHSVLANEAGFNGSAGPNDFFFDVDKMRPYWSDKHNDARVRVNVGNGKSGSMRTNAALLRYDEWKDIDRTVLQVAQQRLTGVSDLISRGLTYNLGTIGATVSQWDRASDMTGADVDMDAPTRGEEDSQEFDQASVPVPIVHKGFRIGLRRLEASRRMGQSVDTSQATVAARKVSEGLESMLFNGSTKQVAGSSIPGYTTHPDRNTVDLATKWDEIAGEGGEEGNENALILTDVQNMLAMARADRYYGPFVLYVPSNYEGKLDEDYRAGGDNRTIRQRILAIEAIAEVKVADFLADDNVLLVQMTEDVVDWAEAQGITTVMWNTLGGMLEHFKVMAVAVPRVKSEYDGRSGIVHLRAS